ncbi:hypothetical protein ATY81_02390 [Rhizobium sp. R72]|nr:hypothetical protein ATY81_02390 [Rhizobium sp. R72]OWW05900.1 hypothetical protein ATY80_02390 [Rhizobium sp. R711]
MHTPFLKLVDVDQFMSPQGDCRGRNGVAKHDNIDQRDSIRISSTFQENGKIQRAHVTNTVSDAVHRIFSRIVGQLFSDIWWDR